MKKIYLLVPSLLVAGLSLTAQPCASSVAAGSSSNAFTNIRNATNAVAADKDLNTVLFIHRNNATTFGGHSGQLRYDISTNGGSSWSNDLGVLNPLSVNGTNAARYPQVAIYNPAGNTNPSNAYLSYMGATVAASFNGIVSGVRQLNGTGNTETYNQPASSQTLIPNSMCKGAPGIFWAIDEVYNGSAVTGFRVYKGTWNGTNDVVWTTNATLVPSFNTAYNGAVQAGDYHIAFDPTGQIGWVSILTHISPGPTPYSFYPVFYKTTDGGATWSSAMQVDIGQFNCITGNITAGNYASTAFESDLTVDVYGNPHLLTTICNGNNAYAVFFGLWHHMYDITLDGGLWNAIDIANVNAGRATFGTAPNTATMDNQPMISRSADGTKVFFAWTDNSTYTAGAANTLPNIFSCGYNAVTKNWTTVRDFTSCNGATAGSMFFPKLAAEMLEPSAGTYKLPVIATTMTSNDPVLNASFRFIDNMTWTNADFTIAQPVATVSINEGASWLLCPGSTPGLSITGSYNQVLWSDNTTNLATTINAPGTYYVTARSGCTIGRDSIVVTGQVLTVSASASTICAGDPVTLTAAGNSLGYSWSQVVSTSNQVSDVPAATTTYTVTGSGDGGCTSTATTTVVVNPLPIITASSASPAICIGDSILLSASGGVTYNWQPLSVNGGSVMVAPQSASTYTVIGIDANGCTANGTITIGVNPLPAVAATSNLSTICAGDTAMLMVSGANSYSWTPALGLGNPAASMTDAFPASTTDYVVAGTDANGCTNYDTVTISVNPLPVILISGNMTVCAGSVVSLFAQGAQTYTWQPGNSTGFQLTDTLSATTIYTVSGTDANGCTNSDSATVVVNPLPVITVNGPGPICVGAAATLTASGASTYYWPSVGSSANPLIVMPGGTTVYSVAGTDANGCTDSTTYTQVVNPLPSVSLNVSATQVCIDDAVLSLSGAGSPAGGVYGGNGVSGSAFDPVVAGLGAQAISYTYTDANGCSATALDQLTVNACTGLAEQQAGAISVYPNPFSTELFISTGSAATATVEVYSLLGEKMMQQSFTGGSLSIETVSWPAGMYLVTVYTPEGRQSTKLVRQ